MTSYIVELIFIKFLAGLALLESFYTFKLNNLNDKFYQYNAAIFKM